MNNIKTSLQSGDWQKGNNAKYGFFPTPLEVVKMEMDLIDFSLISSDLPITLADFTGGEGEQLSYMHEYIAKMGLTPTSYYNEITKARYEIALERYGKTEKFHLLNTDFFYMKLRHKQGKTYSRSCIAILRNNPPYIWLERHGESIRAEDLFFTENTPYNIDNGIQIFELPIHQLISQATLLKKIFYRYENVHILKFPKKYFNNYKQVVVIGQKKKQNSNDIELAELWLERLKEGDIKSIDEVTSPIITLTEKDIRKIKPVNVFRDGRIDEITLTQGLNVILSDLLEAEQKQDSIVLEALIEKPIIEKLPGHIASELASGKYDGLMGNVLIRGGSNKVIEIVEVDEGDKTITEEIEVMKPFIEITNKNGDIIFKDY